MHQVELTTGTLDLRTGALALFEQPPVQLTDQELGLMRHLVARPEEDVTRDALLVEVLGYRPGVQSRAVDDAMKRLRGKVERLPARPCGAGSSA